MHQKNQEVYWEQQGIDQLCGVHTINSLVQGPLFNEIQMAELAIKLDNEEQQLVGGQGGNLYGKSQNVADDGNYSIQVLQNCLSQYGLSTESIESKLNRNEDLSKEQAFICNSQSHWFCIRKVHNQWYNLNSCSVYGPQSISDFYLAAFLQSVKENGYTIFVVKGNFPKSERYMYDNLQKHQRFLTLDQIEKYEKYEKQQKGYKLNIGGYENQDMDKAIEESKKLADMQRNQEMPDISQMTEEQKTKFFQGQGLSLQDSTEQVNYVNFQNFNINQQEDPELLFVMQQSLKQTVAEKFQNKLTAGTNLRFMHPNGEKSTWCFRENSFVEDLYDYAFFKTPDNDNYKFYLSMTHPTRKIINLKQTLDEAEIDEMDTLYITKY